MSGQSPFRQIHGFTLAETVIAGFALSIVLSAMVFSSTLLQRSFAATKDYSRSQSDQKRVLDYVSRDVRSAQALRLEGSGKIVLTLPGDYDGNGNPTDPRIVQGAVVYGAAPTQVAYYLTAGNFVREVNGYAMPIATGADDFQPTFTVTTDASNVIKSVQSSLTFQPAFQRQTRQDSRDGTALTTHTVPRNRIVFGAPTPSPAPTPAPTKPPKKNRK